MPHRVSGWLVKLYSNTNRLTTMLSRAMRGVDWSEDDEDRDSDDPDSDDFVHDVSTSETATVQGVARAGPQRGRR